MTKRKTTPIKNKTPKAQRQPLHPLLNDDSSLHFTTYKSKNNDFLDEDNVKIPGIEKRLISNIKSSEDASDQVFRL